MIFWQNLKKIILPTCSRWSGRTFPFAEKGKEKLWFRIYRSKGDGEFPLKKAAFMVLDLGLVWNKDDKTKLDEDELVVGSFLTNDDLPLPILALEASMHYDKMTISISTCSRYRVTPATGKPYTTRCRHSIQNTRTFLMWLRESLPRTCPKAPPREECCQVILTSLIEIKLLHGGLPMWICIRVSSTTAAATRC